MNYEGKINIDSLRQAHVAIVVAKFNHTITQRLLDGAMAKFAEVGVPEAQIDVFWVPGAFELPLALEKLLATKRYVGAIALGAVIRGETSHDRHINRAISHQFAELSVRHLVPVMFGVLTCNTVEQAVARSGGEPGSHDKTAAPHLGNKGADCAEALLEMIDLFEQMDKI